jgi:hypothetical protein
MSNDQAILSFTCDGKEGDVKTMTCAAQCFFRATKMTFNPERASIEAMSIGMDGLKPEEFADQGSLLKWPTAQPFETIAIVVKLKKEGKFSLNLIGPSRKLKRIEI